MYWNTIDTGVLTDELINSLVDAKARSKPWGDDVHTELRASLRRALLVAQKSKCAYCRREIRDETGRVEIDHILPKEPSPHTKKARSNSTSDRRSTLGYKEFEFCGVNLALTCKRCNNKKGTYDARIDRISDPPAAYSTDPNDYLWVHPYFHKYSEHIELVRGYVFRVVDGSENGDAVITVCGLKGIASLESNAIEMQVKSSNGLESALMNLWANPLLDDAQGASALIAAFAELEFDRVKDVLAGHAGRKLADLESVAREIRAMLV